MATRAVPRRQNSDTPAKAVPAKVNPDKIKEDTVEEDEEIEDDIDEEEDEDSGDDEEDETPKRGRRKKTSNYFDIIVDAKHYRIHSDKHGWSLCVRGKNKAGEYYYTPEAYGSSFFEVLYLLRKRALNTSKYKKLSTLIANAARIDSEIKNYINNTIPVLKQEDLEAVAKKLIVGLGAK